MKRIILLCAAFCAILSAFAQETYLYANKDTSALYLDIHRPAPGVPTSLDSVPKPAIIYIFGGGFMSGARNEAYQRPWFEDMTNDGYTVISIDYRLGMKGYKMGKGLAGLAKSVRPFYTSQQLGVEDLFSAIAFLDAHPELGIDVRNIVITGNSAGAIICLAAAQQVANGQTQNLPDNFAFKGVISFSGAIISMNGAPAFKTQPCPILFFHGMNDNAVAYHHFGAFGMGMWGSSYLAERLHKQGANYSIWRFQDRAHDVAAYMHLLWPEQKAFLENNVIRQTHVLIDATVDNPSLPVWKEWGSLTPQQMYNGQ